MNSGASAFVYVVLRILAALLRGCGARAGSPVLSGWESAARSALYLAWNLWQLRALHFWLQHRSVADPPDAMGLWGDVVAQVVRLHRRKRFHKERLTRLFRELRRSTAAMPDGVVMLDPQGEIVWFNRKAGELLDLSRRADLGLRIDNLVRNPDFVRYLRGGQYSMPVIVRIDTPTERHIAFQLISYGEDQRLLMLRDVTREVRMEQMRKDFVANASHELRSPLTVVAGYLENFSADPRLGELAAPVAEMRRQTDRMTRIIEDLLELSRFEANDAPIKGLPIDVVGDGVDAAQGRAGAPDASAPGRSRHRVGSATPRRRGHGAVRVLQPRGQRRQVHAARWQHADPLVDGRGGRAFLRPRHRPGHFRRASAAPHGTLLPRRSGPLARDRRLGTGAGHRQTRVASPRRHGSKSKASKAVAAPSPVISRTSGCSNAAWPQAPDVMMASSVTNKLCGPCQSCYR